MELTTKLNEEIINLKFDKLCLIFGNNQSIRSKLLETISNNIQKSNKLIQLNGSTLEKNEYQAIYFNEQTDFKNEFKFSNTNLYKSILYDDMMMNIKEENILNEINEIFNIIDKKINNKLKKDGINDLKFDINITSINKIIEKFTEIYFEEYLVSDKIKFSSKRILLYRLLQLYLENNKEKPTIVIIDNFDVYLDEIETIQILDTLEQYAEKFKHVYFIISTNKNIFKNVSNKYSIYTSNKKNIIKFTLNDIIINFLTKKTDTNYTDDDENYIYKNLCLPNMDNIGSILLNKNLIITSNELKTKPYIYYKSTEEKDFYETIAKYIDIH